MTTFLDSEGREWRLALTIGLCRKIRDEVGVDIGNLKDGQAFLQMAADPYRFAETLWMLCEVQAEKTGVSPEQFAEGLTGDALDGALVALLEAAANFTRAPMRGAVRTMLQTSMEATQKGLEAIATDQAGRVQEVVAKAQMVARQGMNQTFGEP
jgi:hypothetical protein